MKKLTLLLLAFVLLTISVRAYESDETELWTLREAEVEPEEAALMAGGSATVRVTVALPTGVTANAGDEIRVYLYTPAEIDASGRVVRESSSVTRATAEFQQGQSTGTAVFQNVAAGKYILRAYTYRMSGGKIRNCTYLFFNTDGSIASSDYTAIPFSVSNGQNVTKTIAIPAADTSISGVLRFSSPLSQDTEFELYCYGQGTNSKSHYVYFTGQRGATSVPFSIGLMSGCYYLRFSLDDYYYLDYNGILTKEGGTHYYCHVTPGAGLSALSVNGDILLSGNGETETGTAKIEVSVTFPAALAREGNFSVCAVSDNTSNSSSTVVEAGQTTFSRTLTLNKSREYVIGYRDTTDCGNIYSPKTAKDVRYLSENGGITTIYENAKKFKFTGDISVSIREPACGRVTGRVNRNGFNAGYWAAAYAYAEFPDGERYCARVLLGTADSAEYVIYVPMTHSGQKFELSAAIARSDSNRPLETSASKPSSMTFNGNVSGGTLTVSGDYFTVSGKVSLPNGVKAPVGGQAVELYAQDSTYYIIPAGQNSVSFSWHDYPNRDDTRSVSLRAYLEGALSGVYPSVSESHYFDNSSSEAERKAWYQNKNLVFPAAAVISGTVSFSSNVRDVGAGFRLYASRYYGNGGSSGGGSSNSIFYVSILKGQSSAPYRITIPVGEPYSLQLTTTGSTNGRVADDTLYIDSKWSVTKERGNGYSAPTITGNRSNVNFTVDVFSNGVTPQIVSVKAGSGGDNVFDYLRSNHSVYVACAGPTGTTAFVIAALYDKQGCFLAAATDSYVDLKRDSQDVYLWFPPENLSNVATIRVFMIDYSTRKPLTRSVTLHAQ